MTWADWLLDIAVASALPVLAWTAVRAQPMETSVVAFIAFGLMSALAWTRLGAVDVALVEASVGAGLTGAMFMTTLSWATVGAGAPRSFREQRRWLLVPTLILACSLGAAVLALPEGRGLTDEVHARLARTGVDQPVTAVLMVFRGYDTLLEVVVLVVAAVGVRGLQAGPPGRGWGDLPMPLRGLVELVFPAGVLLAGYLVWSGEHAPGGAFQAGAVLAGGVVVLMLVGRASGPRLSSRLVRAGLLAGPAVFLLAAGYPVAVGRPLLAYPEDWSGFVVLSLESTLAVSIAVVLLMFFPSVSSQPSRAESARENS